VARAVVAEGGGLSDDGYAPFRRAFAHVAGREAKLDETDFRRIVSPENFVAVRERFGGPGPTAMQAALETYRQAAHNFDARATERAARQQLSEQDRRQRFAALMETR
jgi:argininosuccinate lyase